MQPNSPTLTIWYRKALESISQLFKTPKPPPSKNGAVLLGGALAECVPLRLVHRRRDCYARNGYAFDPISFLITSNNWNTNNFFVRLRFLWAALTVVGFPDRLGTLYAYSSYAGALKHIMGYTQTDSNLVSSVGALGLYATFPRRPLFLRFSSLRSNDPAFCA